jgi:sulfide dehydrogenase cytochrome subunit
MIGKKTRYILFITIGWLLNSITWATTDNLSLLVGNCDSCHGPKGSSLGPAVPTIAGMSEDTFLEAMEAYQQDDRPSTIMGRIAKGYTEADFQQMATYFSKQPFVRYPQKVDANKVQQGQKLHKDYCEKCHEDNGFTDEDGSSILAGQWLPYLQFSLADFQAGNRSMTKKMKKRMEKMVKAHGEASLDNVAHFYSSQTEMTK